MFNLEYSNISLSLLIRTLLPIGIVAVVVGLYFAIFGNSDKTKKITKITLASFIAFLLLFRFCFWIFRAIEISGGYSFSSFLMSLGINGNYAITTLLMYVAMIALYVSAFSKNNNLILDFCKHTLLGIGFPFGIIQLFRLDLIVNTIDNVYHVLNIISILFTILLLFIPVYFLKIGELRPRLSKFWLAISGYTIFASLCMTLSIVTRNGNIAEMTYATSLRQLGIEINFPWHLLITVPAFLIICFIVYYIVTYAYKKITHDPVTLEYRHRNEFFDLYSFATKSLCSMQGLLLLIILGTITRNPMGTLWGLFCLIPLIMTVFCVWTAYEMEEQAELDDESVFDKGNKTAQKIITTSLIGNLIFGAVVAKQIKNERESIIERKAREEKRKQRELQKQKENIDEN